MSEAETGGPDHEGPNHEDGPRVAGDTGGVLTPPVTRQHAAAAREEARGVAARASAPVRASMTVRDDGTVRLALRVKAEAGGVAAKASAVRASLTKPSTILTVTLTVHNPYLLQPCISNPTAARGGGLFRGRLGRTVATLGRTLASLCQTARCESRSQRCAALPAECSGRVAALHPRPLCAWRLESTPTRTVRQSSLRSRCNAVALVFMAELSIPYGLQTNQRNVDMWLPLEFREKIEHFVRATHLEQGGRWSASNKRMPCDVLDQLAPWALESILTVDPKYLRACLHADESAGGLFSPSARPQRLSRRIRDPNVARERLAGRRYAITLRHPAKRQRYSIGSSDELASLCAVVNLTELAVHV